MSAFRIIVNANTESRMQRIKSLLLALYFAQSFKIKQLLMFIVLFCVFANILMFGMIDDRWQNVVNMTPFIQKKREQQNRAGLILKTRNLSHHNCYYFTARGDRKCVPENEMNASMQEKKSWGKPWQSEVNVFFYQNDIPFGGVHSDNYGVDYSWVEVMRWKTFRDMYGGDGQKYGTWMWAMPGSGIYVNIGKAWRFSSRNSARRAILTNKSRKAEKVNIGFWQDWHFCLEANERGYDSVMFNTDDSSWRHHESGIKRNQAEIILCGDMNHTNSICAGIEWRQHNNKPCVCNDTAPRLSCV